MTSPFSFKEGWNLSSVIQVCNTALSYLGCRRIDSLTEHSEEARAAALHYELCRNELLRGASWNFARRVMSLARLDKAVPGWDGVYQLPLDCLYVLDLYGAAGRSRARSEYRLMGREVLCGFEKPWAEYISSEADPATFDSLFVAALAYRLAAAMAHDLTGNGGLKNQMMQCYQQALAEARLANGTEGYLELAQSRRYLEEGD